MRVAALLLMGSLGFAAVDPGDEVLVPFLQKEDPRLRAFFTAARRHVDATHDLVLVLGTRDQGTEQNDGSRLGLFLRERQHPDRIRYMGSEAGISSFCPIQFQRITSRDVVYFCEDEDDHGTTTGHYLLYDIKAGRVTRQAKFAPFFFVEGLLTRGSGHPIFFMDNGHTVVPVGIDRAGGWRVERQDAPVLRKLGIQPGMPSGEFGRRREQILGPEGGGSFGPHNAFRLEVSQNDFGLGGMAIHGLIEATGGETRKYLLPQSSFEKHKLLRPDDDFGPANEWESHRGESVGPYQVEGSRFWFGNYFWAEGETGVGAFGYFDMEKREWTLYSPPEVAPWSITALLVERDAVWLGICRSGEAPETCGGIVRWDRKTHEARRIPSEWGVSDIVRRGDTLYMTAGEGLLILRGGRLQKFIISICKSGGYEVVPVLEPNP